MRVEEEVKQKTLDLESMYYRVLAIPRSNSLGNESLIILQPRMISSPLK